jgi:glycogen operon protein
MGSPDIYPQPDRETNRSINFLTCHDGFTLNDLVSYDAKHNEPNKESNKDGYDFNISWNCGIEGPTDNLDIENLRLRQIKNFLTILFTSQGTPMLLMGDEIRRTQRGNNNAYCQDNETSWFNWNNTEKHSDLLRFVQGLIRFSRSHSVFNLEHIPRSTVTSTGVRITWHGVHLDEPDFTDDSHSLAFEMMAPIEGEHIFVMLSAFWKPLTFELPLTETGYAWHRVVDTSIGQGEDYCPPGKSPRVEGNRYLLKDRSVAVLVAHRIKERY